MLNFILLLLDGSILYIVLLNKPEPVVNSNSGPEQDEQDASLPDDDEFINKTIENNNIITVEPKHEFTQKCKLDLADLKSTPVSRLYDFLIDKEIILKEYSNISGIYLIHNNVNGKQYVGSGMDLRIRLANYYFPSRLADNRYISRSILKYGHGSFSVIILDVLGKASTTTKVDIISKEQHYIDLYKPVYNLNPTAGSSLGFKHSKESRRLISEARKGVTLSDAAKKRLSILFSGELNPF